MAELGFSVGALSLEPSAVFQSSWDHTMSGWKENGKPLCRRGYSAVTDLEVIDTWVDRWERKVLGGSCLTVGMTVFFLAGQCVIPGAETLQTSILLDSSNEQEMAWQCSANGLCLAQSAVLCLQKVLHAAWLGAESCSVLLSFFSDRGIREANYLSLKWNTTSRVLQEVICFNALLTFYAEDIFCFAELFFTSYLQNNRNS